jgi:hypothetical protein
MINKSCNVAGLFRPLLKSSRPTFEQLREFMRLELRTSTDASLLAAKLYTCNENVAQIRQFLSSVANRGLKMKDHMKRILKGGKYQFTGSASGCNLKLTCGDTGFLSAATIFDAEVTAKEETGVYLLAELQDIRSRARLVLSTHKAQAKRYLKHESGMYFRLILSLYSAGHLKLMSKLCPDQGLLAD